MGEVAGGAAGLLMTNAATAEVVAETFGCVLTAGAGVLVPTRLVSAIASVVPVSFGVVGGAAFADAGTFWTICLTTSVAAAVPVGVEGVVGRHRGKASRVSTRRG